MKYLNVWLSFVISCSPRCNYSTLHYACTGQELFF